MAAWFSDERASFAIMAARFSDARASFAIMAAEGEMNSNGDLGEPSAMEAAEVSTLPPPEMSDENGCTDSATEASAQPETAFFSAPPDTEDEGSDLPADFERLWNAAHDNPRDFTSWTDLLQYCEQEVCVQGLQSIPLSVDLWIHYINLLLGTLDMNLPESPKHIRSVFEDAVVAAGLDFHSNRLWDLYFEWEKEQGDLRNATAVLDRVLKVPTQHYNTHYEKFKVHLNNSEPKEALSLEEYEEVRAFCRESQKVERAEQAKEKGEERPPGEEEPATPEGTDSEELMQRMREQVLVRRDKIYQENENEVRKRWNFEDTIKRPYFHVKPLDQTQLRGWHSYLDWEVAQLKKDTQDHNKDLNKTDADVKEDPEVTAQPQREMEETKVFCDDHRVRFLFERCLIACALYEEFWTRYIQYLETCSVDEVRAVYKRACDIHLPSTPNIHMQRATFEERHGDLAEARRVLEALDKNMPGLAVVRLRRAALERRAGQLEQSEALLQEAVTQSKEKPTLHAFYSIKLARLFLKLGRNPSRARSVLQEALEISPDNDKLHLNLLEVELSAETWSSAEAVQQCVTRALEAPLTPHTKILLSQRGLQFVEEYSNSIQSVLSVYEAHQKLIKELGGTKREAESGDEGREKLSKGDGGSANGASEQVPPTDPQVPVTMPPPPPMSIDASAQSGGYGGYSSWYQQPQYSSYGYQNTWNYNQGYYPPS
ncbi:pre-mRNA-processing factor 39 isoform X2 [Phyllopteryx taeniolatus]|uniref:pre-mRNA-processing factor 39 isoform X2 n=1 Tax=Phyllopteryx taeniolatus TaxID=161469 RepID=UPI002AD4D837|nr:pre-mRNA-processing factor 39 isoform X2 [Phyllopteryx taeniolatus]